MFISSTSSAHVIEPNEMGIDHALLSLNHILMLVFMGFGTAALMLTRKQIVMSLANVSLLSVLVWQAYFHAGNNSILVGLEFFIGGALISLAAWRGLYLMIPCFSRGRKMTRKLFHYFLTYADRYLRFPNARAHCDIPCKIYDPLIATVSALSVIRLIDIINEVAATENQKSIAIQNTIARCIQRKEEESEKLKQEIRIIWGDYFKAPQIEKFPEIHELAHEIMILASAAKQKVDREEACSLLESVNKFSEIFWSTKGIDTERKLAPYPPSLEVVRPK